MLFALGTAAAGKTLWTTLAERRPYELAYGRRSALAGFDSAASSSPRPAT